MFAIKLKVFFFLMTQKKKVVQKYKQHQVAKQILLSIHHFLRYLLTNKIMLFAQMLNQIKEFVPQ